MLAWRLLHDPALTARAAALGPLLPRPAAELDRDPVALALAALASAVALAYLVAALAGARPRLRMALLAMATIVLVVLPTLAFVAMGAVTGRPYGQDGGVVQLPLAIDRILAGHTPYGADYSDSMLGRQARVSDFWTEHGGNPILHHHAYLPGTHLLMVPFLALSRSVAGTFDPRIVTLLAFGAAGLLAFRLAGDPARGLCAAAAVWVSPLVYWQQIFGANDIVVAALLLASVHLALRSRAGPAAAVLGLACATKQLAWPFAPFLLASLSGARSLRELASAPARGRLLRATAIAAGVFVVVVLPVAALDFHAFWGDVVRYNAGLPGGDNYPLGGTPGLGLANLVVYFGGVSSLRDYVPLGWWYVLLVPVGVVLLREQLRRGTAADALVTGSAALLLSLYGSRVMHPNYLILAAVLLPAAAAAGAELTMDVLVGGLALLATAVDIAEGQVYATTWADAAAERWPSPGGLAALVAPRAGPGLTQDPLGLALSALASAAAIALVMAGVLRARRLLRAIIVGLALGALVVVPTAIVGEVGRLSGTPRVQAGWAATVWPRTAGDSGPRLREAWSVSFRKDPPRDPSPAARGLGDAVPAGTLRVLHVADPRLIALACAVLAGVLIVTVSVGRSESAGGAAALLVPAAVLGTVFGSGGMVVLAVVLGAVWLTWRRSLVSGIALIAVGGALAGALGRPELGPGVGLSNLRLYAGTLPGSRDLIGPILLAFATVLAIVWGIRARSRPSFEGTGLAIAAAVSVAALWLASSASPDVVAVPIVLLALAAERGSAAEET